MLYPKLRHSRPVQGHIDLEEDYDAYQNTSPPEHEPAVCPDCGSVYRNKHWQNGEGLELNSPTDHLCPGCRKVRDGYYYGEVRLGGTFLIDHRDEILNLIVNETERLQKDNPIARIVQARAQDGQLLIRTTNAKLAEHIGRMLEKSYDGTLERLQDHDIARYKWSRSDDSDT